jgi:hypothetical protein
VANKKKKKKKKVETLDMKQLKQKETTGNRTY